LIVGVETPSSVLWLEDVKRPTLGYHCDDLLFDVMEEPPDGAAAHTHSLPCLLLRQVLEVYEPEVVGSSPTRPAISIRLMTTAD